jgi:hypothetical protein
MTNVQENGFYTKVMRWIARIVGLLASGLFVYFVICAGLGICSNLSWSSPRGMPLFVVMALSAVGALIAWRWEMVGGTMAALGAVAVSALVFFGSGRAMFTTALMISLPFFIAGVLFLICCWRTRTETTLA